jgi:hypothetical protein
MVTYHDLSETGAQLDAALDKTGDFDITSPVIYETLSYNGTSFVNDLGPNYKSVWNLSGATIAQGSLVTITGTAGAVPLVTVADKDTHVLVSGLAMTDIINGTGGIIQVRGTIQDSFINTLGLTAGNALYLGDAGAYTETKPATGYIIIGAVGVVADSNGSILLDCPAHPVIIDGDARLTDALHTIASASGATELDYTDGTVFAVTATADISITYANLPAVGGIVIYATNWGAHAITLPSGTVLAGGEAPTFTASGLDIITVTTKNSGTATEFLIAAQDVKAAS